MVSVGMGDWWNPRAYGLSRPRLISDSSYAATATTTTTAMAMATTMSTATATAIITAQLPATGYRAAGIIYQSRGHSHI